MATKSNYVFTYGNFTKEFDFSDYEVLERVQKSLEEWPKLLEQLQKKDSMREVFHALVNLFETVVDDEQATNKALGKCSSLDKLLDLVMCFNEFVINQRRAGMEALNKRATVLQNYAAVKE